MRSQTGQGLRAVNVPLQARSRLAQRFSEHQSHIGRACNALLAVYREANRKTRRTPEPGYFTKTYEIERIIYVSDGKEETARDRATLRCHERWIVEQRLGQTKSRRIGAGGHS